MNDAGFIDPNSEWSVTVGEDGSVEVNRLDLKEENAKLRELVEDMLSCIEIRAAFNRPPTTDMYEQFAKRASELGIEVDE